MVAGKGGPAEQSRLWLAVLLTGAAAWVDAVGLVAAGDLYVSFMSGNNAEAAVSATRLDLGRAGEVAAVIGLFLAGVVLGELLCREGTGWRQVRVWLVEAALLWLALLGHLQAWPTGPWLALLALAMGMHNASLHPARGAAVRTYITGTIVQFGRAVAEALRGRPARAELVSNGAAWAGFAGGAILGGLVAVQAGIAFALAIAAAFATAMALAGAAALRRQRQAVRENQARP